VRFTEQANRVLGLCFIGDGMKQIEQAKANYSIPGEYTAMALRSFSAALDLAEAAHTLTIGSWLREVSGGVVETEVEEEDLDRLNATLAAFLATLPEED
jgi:hypothetical protein